MGDRLTSTVNSSTTNYGYSTGTHRLASLSGGQSKSYTLDAAGNMTSDGTTTWTYGGNNRPTSAGTTTFSINALGQRVRKVGATTTRFVFDEAGRLWGEYSTTETLIQETVWLGDLPVATIRPNGSAFDLYYVHTDQLGTPRKITRPSDNAIVWRWDNTEGFGNSAPNENPSGLGTFAYNLRFPGQYFDSATETHYNYFRDYDPAIGRFIESDPIGLKGGLNTFSYVGDPLGTVDPKGLASLALAPAAATCGPPCWLALGVVTAGMLVYSICNDDDPCTEGYERCVQKGLDRKRPGGKSICGQCRERCRGSGGNWPNSINISGGGSLNIWVACE